MSKSVPKVLRCDALLFRLGTSYRQVRKGRDRWEQIDDPSTADDAAVAAPLYYEDIRPEAI